MHPLLIQLTEAVAYKETPQGVAFDGHAKLLAYEVQHFAELSLRIVDEEACHRADVLGPELGLFPRRGGAERAQKIRRLGLAQRRERRLFALAGTIERRVRAAAGCANKLPQAILSKAFSGELVPTEAELARLEGRTYETAEELLKRVIALGSDAPSKRKGRGRRARKEE